MSGHLPNRTEELFSQVFAIAVDAEAGARTAGLRTLSGRGDGDSALMPVQWIGRPEVVDALAKAAAPHLLVQTRQEIRYWAELEQRRSYTLAIVLHATTDPARLELEGRVRDHDGTTIVWLDAELLLVRAQG